MSGRHAISFVFRVALVGCVAALLVACRKSDTIAELTETAGAVDRDHAARVGAFEGAAPGATFLVGDGVRTGDASRAALRLFDASRLELEPKTLVRFLDRRSGPKSLRLDVQAGEAVLEASAEALDLELAVGSAHLDAHGRARLSRTGDRTRLEVVIGSAQILGAGETLALSVGDAIDVSPTRVERVAPPPAAAASSAPAPAVPPPSASSATPEPPEPLAVGEAASRRARGPSVVDFALGAGDSVVIHDPSPPTAVAFATSSCESGALLTLDPGKRARETVGSGRVSVDVPSGSHRYSIACLEPDGKAGKHVADGTLTVMADSGARRLAKSAPLTHVDADGRHYTVLYQSLLPKLAVRWPNSPESSHYTLAVSSNGNARSFSSPTPSYSFSSGVFAEGQHVFTFEAEGRRSRPTSVVIRFDNAAPTASIASPENGSFAPGGSTLVAGSALPGWTVSAYGRELKQDPENRFSEMVSVPAGERALVIRFSQPGRGVHYYLRRSAR